MIKYLLALDQSTATTGFAMFRNGELLKAGHVSPIEKDYVERIVALRQWIERIINTLDSELEVALEDIQLQQFEPNGGKRVSKDLLNSFVEISSSFKNLTS